MASFIQLQFLSGPDETYFDKKQVLINIVKKNIPHTGDDADSKTNITVRWTKNTQNHDFF